MPSQMKRKFKTTASVKQKREADARANELLIQADLRASREIARIKVINGIKKYRAVTERKSRVIQEFIIIIERIEEMIDEMDYDVEADGGIHKTILYDLRDDYVPFKSSR